MKRWAIVVAVLVGAAGCNGDDGNVGAACDNVCTCQSALPAVHDTCMAECLDEAPGTHPKCLACLAAAACHELDDCFQDCGLDGPAR